MHEGKPLANVEGLEDAPEHKGNPEDERETAQKGPNRARDNRPGMAQETQPRSLPPPAGTSRCRTG